MILNNFTSLFEIFAAFNFAYILSDSFNKHLTSTIIRSNKIVLENLQSVKDKMEIAKDSIHKCPAIANSEVVTTPALQNVKDRINSFENRFEKLKVDVDEAIGKAGLSFSFIYLCLYNSLFCITTLFIVGFLDGSDSVNDIILNGTIAVFDLSSSIFLGYALALGIKESLRWNLSNMGFGIGYKSTLICFMCSSIFSLTYYVIYKCFSFTATHFYNYRLAIVIWTITLPVFHFIFFFFKAHTDSFKYSIGLNKRVNEYSNDFNTFHADEVTPLLSFTVSFDRYKPGDRSA